MNIPLLFTVFNRPEITKRVFSVIRNIKPKKLFIAADGPREHIPDERKLCEKVRAAVNEINWSCEVKKLYRSTNLGCKKAVSSAIDWFFESVEEGIILEDDCLPNPSFFDFCEKMLRQYRNNKRVMHVSGNNFQRPENYIKNGYYFSKYPHVWGWATWRRAWKKYDVAMGDWPKIKKQKRINYLFDSIWEKEYWYTLFDATYKGRIDTWDYQWVYTIWKNSSCAITPGVNLVENLGFGKNSTHFVYRNLRTKSRQINFPLVYLKNSRKRVEFDRYISKTHYGISFPMVVYQKTKFIFGKSQGKRQCKKKKN